ncbi:hypothetical protein HZB78_05445 [Candidatus Collierbacteria bacterium]|nr:hypothetical protein [Candidatus Collierbacteria bacterium]
MWIAKIIHRYVKNRKGKYPQEEIERNCRLYADYRRSHFIVPLVSKYRISSKRIYQIINQVERGGGSPKKVKKLTGAQLLEKRRRAIKRLRNRLNRFVVGDKALKRRKYIAEQS